MSKRIYLLFLLSLTLGLFFSHEAFAKKKDLKKDNTAQATPEPKEMNPEAYHHFTNGVIYEQEGVFDEAVKEYELALSYEPLSTDIRSALGNIYFSMNRPAQAIDALLPIADKDSKTYGLLGDCFRVLGRGAEAEEAYNRALKDDPYNISINYNLGLMAVHDGRINDAARYFQSAAKASGNTDLYKRVAEMFSSARMYDSAAAYLELAITSSEPDSDLFSSLAVAYHSAGKSDKSKAALYRGIAAFPGDARLRSQLLETYVSESNADSVKIIADQLLLVKSPQTAFYERVGQILLRMRQNDRAIAMFSRAVEIDSTSRFGLFYLGRLAIERSQLDTARIFFNRLVAVDSTAPDGWINLAFILDQKKQTDAAINLLKKALDHVTPDRDNVRFYLAQLLSGKQMPDSSVALLKQVIAEGGDTIRALFMIGSTYERAGNFDKSVESFELLLTIDSTHAQTLNYLGYMFAEKGVRLDESIQMIQRAVAQDTANGAYLDSYAWVLYKLKRYDEALIEIKKALTVIKDDATVTEHLGDIEFALGNVEDARRAWQTALTLDPKNQELKSKLATK